MELLLEPEQIKHRRLELGLTQQKLAELSGLAIRTVCRAESGENGRGGTLKTLKAISEAFQKAKDR